MFFTFKTKNVMLITGLNQSDVFNYILTDEVSVPSNTQPNQDSQNDEDEELLFGSQTELARIVGISVFHGSFPFFLWVFPNFSVYLR